MSISGDDGGMDGFLLSLREAAAASVAAVASADLVEVLITEYASGATIG